MSSNIPEARKILQTVLDECGIDNQARMQIESSLSLMVRDSYKHEKARSTARKITPDLRAEVLDYYFENPTAQTKHIGERFGISCQDISTKKVSLCQPSGAPLPTFHRCGASSLCHICQTA